MPYTLPALPYAYNALEPHFDARTMEIHHTKHHQAYITNVNNALAGANIATPDCVCELLSDLSKLPEAIRGAVRNNGGGHANHSLFWEILAPGAGGAPTGDLAAAIDRDLGGLAKFKEDFAKACMTRFGSGWGWLVTDASGKLSVCSTANQDTPAMGKAVAGCEGWPVLGLDVWEHAYYLHYQNRRADFVTAFWNVVNWAKVSENYAKALQAMKK